MTCLRLLCCALALCAWVGRAHATTGAEHLAKAHKALEELRFDEAQRELDVALRAGDNDAAAVAEIYRLSAQVAASLGDPSAAQGYFERLLVLQPGFVLPEGTSPKITEPLAAAHASLEGAALAARVEVDAKRPALRVVIESDPRGMVAGVRVHASIDGAGGTVLSSNQGPTSFQVPLPQAERIEAVVDVVDRYGNQLLRLGSEAEPILVVPGKGTVKKPKQGGKRGKSRPLYARWWLWSGVTLVAAGAGTYFALDVIAAQDEIEELNEKSKQPGAMIPYTEAQAIEQRGKRSAIGANVAFGVAGAAAIGVVLCLVTGGDDDAGAGKGAAWAPSIGADGLGVVYSGSW